jgi:predicted ATPase/transcriptional regulator with XRE-family HTH domain
MDKSEVPVIFGEWVKKRRKALDLTQEELAQRTGCSVFALRKIESGERRPSKQLADLLAESLEIPSEEKQTFIRVARGESSLERLHLPPLDSSLASLSHPQPASVSNRIPLQPTPLLGRDSELAAMERLFGDPQCRLLTLTGMGGIGKTRLAIEFATGQQPAFPGGVFYIPLAPINSPEAIVPAIAEVFGFVFSGPSDPKEQLINYIAVQMNQPALLVLDNLEHLLVQSLSEEKQGAAGLISEFLQRLPNIRILTTSRERLNLQGEWTYELHGLAVPPLEFSGKLENYSAAALFLQSALRVKADFELTATEQQALIQICQLLDGTPLAIELAAAWAGVLSCHEISQEIGSNIDFLTTSMRDVPERHRSLRATFDHSWRLLSDQERDVLSRLSIFRGGFDRTAAEKVVGATLPLLASLVSKSLVRRVENVRYDLHEVIRQYASSHLEYDNARCRETCSLHSEYYLTFASEYERKLKSASQQAAMRDMSLELDNLRTAWEWGIGNAKFESIGKAVRSFGWFFEVSGLIREGIDHLELLVQALNDKPRDHQMDRALGTTLVQQGLLYFRSGQFMRAQELYDDSITILRSVNEPALLADALIFNGTLRHLNGEYLGAKVLIEEGLACAQAVNDQWFIAYGIYNLGHIDSLMGEYQKGYEQMQEGMKIWREVGDLHSISLGLNFLVNTQIKLERYDEASEAMRESIALCEQTKNRWGMGTAYRYLGLATLAGGQYVEAQGYIQKSLEIFGEYFEGWDIALSFVYLGDAVRLSGDVDEARKIYLRALRISLDSKSIPIAMDSLLGLAHLRVRAGNPEGAFEISYHVLKHPSITQETRDCAIEVCDEAQKKMTDIRIQAIKADTLNRTFEETVSSVMLEDL